MLKIGSSLRSFKIYTKAYVMLIGRRTLTWVGEIDDHLYDHIFRQLMHLLEGDEETPPDWESPITLYIVSPGGDAPEAYAFYDLVRYVLSPTPPIITIGSGVVASAAVIILLSVPRERRFITPNSALFLHQGNVHLPDGEYTTSQIDGMARTIRFSQNRYIDIIASETGLPRRKIKNMMTRETVIPAHEAKRLGFVHDILPARHV